MTTPTEQEMPKEHKTTTAFLLRLAYNIKKAKAEKNNKKVMILKSLYDCVNSASQEIV